jgi:hypothetical protein
MAAGQHQLGSGRGRRERQAPGVGVKHRHDSEYAVGGRDAEHVGLQQLQCVQEARAVRVGHSFRRSGRAGREAQAARGALVEAAPGHGSSRLTHRGLDVDDVAVATPRRRRPVDDQYPCDYGRTLDDLSGQRFEIGAGNDDAAACSHDLPRELRLPSVAD